MLVDHRCPKCDRPVKGRREVTTGLPPLKPANKCQHCGCRVRLSEPFEDGLSLEQCYEAVSSFNRLRS